MQDRNFEIPGFRRHDVGEVLIFENNRSPKEMTRKIYIARRMVGDTALPWAKKTLSDIVAEYKDSIDTSHLKNYTDLELTPSIPYVHNSTEVLTEDSLERMMSVAAAIAERVEDHNDYDLPDKGYLLKPYIYQFRGRSHQIRYKIETRRAKEERLAVIGAVEDTLGRKVSGVSDVHFKVAHYRDGIEPGETPPILDFLRDPDRIPFGMPMGKIAIYLM